MGKLAGKVIIITGCASGLGKQQAIRCAEEGANLAICSRTESKLMETKEICEEKGVKVLAMALDIREYASLKEFVDKTVYMFGTVDVSINNAHTITRPAPFMDKTIEDLDIEMQSSVYAYWNLMQLCFPYLKTNQVRVAQSLTLLQKRQLWVMNFMPLMRRQKKPFEDYPELLQESGDSTMCE